MSVRFRYCGACALLVAATMVAGGCAQSHDSLDTRQLERIQRKYPEADTNGDGALSEGEARLFLGRKRDASRSGHRTPRERLRQSFLEENPEADRDGDAILSYEEWRAFRTKPRPDFADVPYGLDDRNLLDLWIVRGVDPSPLVMFIHGGGFVEGDKSRIDAQLIRDLLAAGISVASMNYRYATTAPYPASMLDAARAVQFLRYNAPKYHLDPARLGLTGNSAGAVIALWLAFHDDLADPQNNDPVLRESTRITCVAPVNAPTSLDPSDIQTWLDMDKPPSHPALFPFFGIQSAAELAQPQVVQRIRDASPINHLTPDDPPVFMLYRTPNVPLPEEYGPEDYIHHPRFGVRLKRSMTDLGIEAVLNYPGHQEDRYVDAVDFFCAKFGFAPSGEEEVYPD